MAVVKFDIDLFRQVYPEFSSASDAYLEYTFDSVCATYIDNTDASIVNDIKERQYLIFLLVAHLCYLDGKSHQGGDRGGLVGKISSASEGSVSVSVDNNGSNDNSWWYLQSPYGASYWQATSPYRTMIYHPGGSPSRYPDRYYRSKQGRWGR